MNKSERVPMDLAEVEWNSPDEPINDVVWQISATETPLPIQIALICSLTFLIVALVLIFIIRKRSIH